MVRLHRRASRLFQIARAPRSAVSATPRRPGTTEGERDPIRLHDKARRPGYGYGASAVRITRRLLALLPSFGGGRMLQATGCVPAPAALVAAEEARPSSGQGGPAIISDSIRFP
jgi:hypothetical protein